jgi:hypothetical protein
MSSFFYLKENFFSAILWNKIWIFYLRESGENFFPRARIVENISREEILFFIVGKYFSVRMRPRVLVFE